jgi:hypothetical protein
MPKADIANQLTAGNSVLRHNPGRTIAFASLHLAAAAAVGFLVVHDRTRRAFEGGVAGFGIGYLGLVAAFRAFRGVPVLRASEPGIWINALWGGRIFVSWPDTLEFAPRFYSVTIRLRAGAKPVGSMWARIASVASAGWARRTVLVPLWETGADPSEIANALSALRSRCLAG